MKCTMLIVPCITFWHGLTYFAGSSYTSWHYFIKSAGKRTGDLYWFLPLKCHINCWCLRHKLSRVLFNFVGLKNKHIFTVLIVRCVFPYMSKNTFPKNDRCSMVVKPHASVVPLLLLVVLFLYCSEPLKHNIWKVPCDTTRNCDLWSFIFLSFDFWTVVILLYHVRFAYVAWLVCSVQWNVWPRMLA
jgi:hypothetical protein